ncbi:solute carrier family 22 member 23-like, partial [Clarias magur]
MAESRASAEDPQSHPHHPHHPQSPPENGSVTPEAPSPGLLLSRVDGCVLPFLGGFGRYHKQLVLLTWIPALFIGFSQHSDTVLLARPNTTCLMSSAGDTAWDNLTTTPTTTRTTTLITTGHSVLTARTAAEQRNTSAHCACDNQSWAHELHSGLSENVWNLVCDSTWKVHIAKFSLLVGSIFGYLVLGVLADWFGRHAVLVVSVFFTLVFGMSVAFSINVTMFSTLRFFEGFWLAGIALSLYVLRIELCLPGWRFSMTMVANFVVLAAQLLMPGIAVLCYDWKILQAVIIGPLALMLTYIWIFPESLRWLLATKQYCRAKWLIERIAKKNNTNVDSHELITELNRVLEKPAQKTCIVKMVGTRNLWKNIVVLCVNSLTGYGIHHCFARSMMGEDNDHPTMFNNFYADYYTMAGIAVATGLALCPAVGIMGRRGGLLMFMIITALASLLDLGLLNLMVKYRDRFNMEPKTRSNFQVAFSIIGMFSSQAVSHLSIFFCAEITPTVI